jgi:DNA-nicking Smr family endonuclease
MKTPKPSVTSKSFQDLKTLLKKKAVSLPPCPAPVPVRRAEPKTKSEEELFREAMQGVDRISRENCVERILVFRPSDWETPPQSGKIEDAEALSQLTRLVKEGEGFRVEDTPEYIEGTSYDIPPEIAGLLHQGRYSIQAHLDLHGMNAQDAQTIFEKFLKWALSTGKRGVLIIHGRGLTSPAEPVLKTRVIEWLTRGPWRKWVAAYASARLHDGGAGGTYVLLRGRAVTKNQKKGK